MGQTRIINICDFTSVIILIFIVSIISFMFQYQEKRRAQYELGEKKMSGRATRKGLLTARLKIQQQTMQDLGRGNS